jgi:double-stranded uracil-DNA glycosylase
MSNLEGWCSALRAALPVDHVPEVSHDEGRIEAVVWEEKAAGIVRLAASRIGIPEAVVHITRPLVFLVPYPDDEERSEAAYEQFLAENVRTDRAGNTVLLSSMPPLRGDQPRVLILGSMPGDFSLQRGEYYAHPRNRFWRIIEDVLGIPHEAPYASRVAALSNAGIALWDVLKHCSRVGSLDSAIVHRTEVANDIAEFLLNAPDLQRIVFNGRKAGDSFRRLVEPAFPEDRPVQLVPAPSTRAANTRLSYSELVLAWREALAASDDGSTA